MPRNRYPEETIDRILKVSYELFMEKGYEQTTIQDITDRLGMSKGVCDMIEEGNKDGSLSVKYPREASPSLSQIFGSIQLLIL